MGSLAPTTFWASHVYVPVSRRPTGRNCSVSSRLAMSLRPVRFHTIFAGGLASAMHRSTMLSLPSSRSCVGAPCRRTSGGSAKNEQFKLKWNKAISISPVFGPLTDSCVQSHKLSIFPQSYRNGKPCWLPSQLINQLTLSWKPGCRSSLQEILLLILADVITEHFNNFPSIFQTNSRLLYCIQDLY